MKKLMVVIFVLLLVFAFTGCAEFEEYAIKKNLESQEAEGRIVLTGGYYTEAYYAAKKILKDEGLTIVHDSLSAFPMNLIGESYKKRSEGDRLKDTIITNMIGGKKNTEKVVDTIVKSRNFTMKYRYDDRWKIIKGQMGVLYTGNVTGKNGQGVVVETIEDGVSETEKKQAIEKLKSLINEYVKDPSKMGK